ncbi:Gfo/Idh/MocA family protein [Sphaerisporangium perillae]|uniref:Gfo/Idh/MocA family protein n=1 Tax=Sphaerisporangium perillae TaxID=2935860 RepID=UPI00200FA2A7|nr:Gfo/Idh/MocA family oxidoreductase [Sphaerisporangium perillae]
MKTTRVAMVGLGDIAEKAYLPVLAATPGLDLLLCTRDRATLDRLGEAYRLPARFTSVEQVVAEGIEAAFVHAATRAHVEIVDTLLRAGVHVYVDKPLADHLAGAEKLVRLAGERGRSLMVGFNRRYAPGYAGLRELPRDLVVMQKNRAGQPDDPRRVIFDDFIHVVDTLRFLAPGDISEMSVDVRVREGLLEHVILRLSGPRADSGEALASGSRVGGGGASGSRVGGGEASGSRPGDRGGFTAIGMMSRVSGASEETCEVIGGGAKRRVVNLADVIDYDGGETVTRRGDWIPVARQRGIEQVCLDFLAAVREGRIVTADDTLRTHAICEEIVAAATTS